MFAAAWVLVASPFIALAQAPATPVLSRDNLVAVGTLGPGGSATYTVDYEPRFEGADITKSPVVPGKAAPWLLRMWVSAPGAFPGGVSFSWLDQTPAAIDGSTAGNSGKSTTPQVGGNVTDVAAGTATGEIQQAVLSAAQPGSFSINIFNGSNARASYRLQLYPLVYGKLEPGINPNPAPIPPAVIQTPTNLPSLPSAATIQH